MLRTFMSRFFIIILFLSVAQNSYAQDWLELYNQSVNAYENNDFTTSKEKSELALAACIADLGENHKNTAAIYRQLTLTCYAAFLLEEGIVYAKKELAVLKAIGLGDKVEYALGLFNLGLLELESNHHDESIDALNRALDLYLVYLLPDHKDVAETKGILATAYFFKGDIGVADSLFSDSYSVLSELETASGEYFNIVYSYSELALAQNQIEKSISLLQDLESFFDPIDIDPEFASILVKLGAGYESDNQMVKASQKYKKANEIFTALETYDAEDNLIAINSLVLLYMKEGLLESATQLVTDLTVQLKEIKDEAYYLALEDLGRIHFLNYKYVDAYSCFEEVKLSGTENQEAYFGALSGMALVDLQRGEFNEAVLEVDAALQEVSGNDDWRRQLLETKAAALTSLGQYKESERILNETIILFEGNTSKIMDLKLSMAVLYTTMQDLDKAALLYQEIKPHFVAEANTAKLQFATFLGNYSSFLQSTNNYVEAENSLIQSLDIKLGLLGKLNENYLATFENLAVLYITTGKYEKAREILIETLDIKEKLANEAPSFLAYTHSYLGVIAKNLGEYDEAEIQLKKALSLYEKEFGKQHVFYANTSNELGLLYLKMGNLKSAKPLFTSSMNTFKEIHSDQHIDYATSLENLATLYQLEGDNEKSKELLEQVLEIDKKQLGTHHPLYSKTLHNLAAILVELKDYEHASKLYTEAISIYADLFGQDHPSFANTLYNVAVLEQELGNYDGAKGHFEQVIEIRKKILNENHPDLAFSIFGLASVKQKLGDYEGARQDYTYTIETYLNSISTIFPSLSEDEKGAFYSKIKPVFEAYQDFAVEYVYHEHGNEENQQQLLNQLYDLQLSTKALLLSATTKVKSRIMSSGDTQLINRYLEWKAVKETLVKALNMSNADLAINGYDITALQLQSNELEKRLSKMSAGFAGEFEKRVISWNDVSASIGENDAAMEILRIKKNTTNDSIYYAALTLKGNDISGPSLTVVTGGENLELKYFKQYKNTVMYKMENEKSYNQYWASIDEGLEGIETLYLSSDGVYNKININTLYDVENKEYVFDKYLIRLLSNTKELAEPVEVVSTDLVASVADVFGFPDYDLGGAITSESNAATERGFANGISALPGTLEETNNISHTLDNNYWKYNLYQGDEATEENIKAVESPKLLHIATHGFFMSNMNNVLNENAGIQAREAKFNPLFRSGLLFAGASKTFRNEKLEGEEDGILTAYEAMNLNLDHTELVVMSACETGLGEVKNGEGVYGLQRAFLVAGADHLIMSLWTVNDETTQKLMSTFYENWLGGQSKQDAFHDAILKLKKKYKQPYYWGAFVMLGK
ncbi:MAG: tetratricopeptide repeat protein [Reichenbachiella sp.]